MSHTFFRPFPLIAFLGAILLIWGCSEDDPVPEKAVPLIRLSTFLTSGSEELQMDVVNDGSAPMITNLNDELGLDFLIFGRRDVDENAVGFYFWQQQLSRSYYKDLNTGLTFSVNDVCGFSSETDTPKVIRDVSGNEDFVVLPYTRQGDAMALEFALRIFDRGASECRDLFLPLVAPSTVENYSIEGDLLGIYYRDQASGNPLLSLIDLSVGSVLETLNLSPDFQAATFNGNELWIFNRDTSYVVFNASSGNFVRSGNAPDLPAQGPGMFDSRFSGNQLLVDFIYQQPSLFFSQPAVYDFDAAALVEGANPFLPELQERIEQATGDRVLFGNYGVDLSSGTIAISYIRGDGSTEGGVTLTTFDLDWFELLELPFLPEEIEVREVQ
ncbi:hypothetical protein [Robiginitalea sp.]|uniref:hypothetical protein n=1 Tax=Robiginitalea sp. TaxID=1902411 RepID=UPI003C7717A8